MDRFHYLKCIFFLWTWGIKILQKGDCFTIKEGVHSYVFTWLAFEELDKAYFYPLQKGYFHLPDHFTMRTEIE